jgi:hypothetical protein
LSAILTFALVACSGDNNSTTAGDAANSDTPANSGAGDSTNMQRVAPIGSPATKTWVDTEEDSSMDGYVAEGNARKILLISVTKYPEDEQRKPSVYLQQGVVYMEQTVGESPKLKGKDMTTLFSENVDITNGSFTVDSDGVHLEATYSNASGEPQEDGAFLKGTLTLQNKEVVEFNMRNCDAEDIENCETCYGAGYIDNELCEQCSGRGSLYILKFDQAFAFLI